MLKIFALNGRKVLHFVGGLAMQTKFVRNVDASIIPMTAVLLMVVVAAVGVALDISRLTNTKTKAQDIADIVSVATLRALMDGKSNDEAKAIGTAFFEGEFERVGDPDLVTLTINLAEQNGARTVDVSLDGSMGTSFMSVVGISTMDFQAASASTASTTDVELVIVADISLSMAKDDKLPTMKDALKELVDLLYPDGQPNEHIRTSILPYAETVYFGDDYDGWLDEGDTGKYIGCFDHESDDQIRSGEMYPIPPGEYEAYTGGNVYCPDDTAASSFFEYDPDPMKEKIDDLSITTGTSTDVATMWAYRALSPTWRGQFVSGSDSHLYPLDFSDGTTKHMIILTDGEAQRWTPRGAERGDELKVLEGRAIALSNFIEICKKMEELDNIHVSTVAFGFSAKDVAMHEYLEDCVSGHGRYFEATTSNLGMVLQEIGSAINRIRLTN